MGQETGDVDALRRELGQLREECESLRVDVQRATQRVLNAVVATLAVGLLVLLATTWLVPVDATAGVDEPRFATGLGLPAVRVGEGHDLQKLVMVFGVGAYVVAAVAVLASALAGPLRRVAPVVGLVATVAIVVAKPSGYSPGAGTEQSWSYAWQTPPYLALALWVGVAAVVLTRPRRVLAGAAAGAGTARQ